FSRDWSSDVCSSDLVANGAEALDYLFARGDYAGRDGHEQPSLVLLDLNLPRMDGREVLQAIRADAGTRSLPVVVMTTSTEPFDRSEERRVGTERGIR